MRYPRPLCAVPSVVMFLCVAVSFAQEQEPTSHQTLASSSDPTTISLAYTALKNPMFFQGDGGTARTVDGIEFWDTGRPQKVNKAIASVSSQLTRRNWGTPDQRAALESALAKLAREIKGDAVIPLTLPDDTAGEGPLRVWIIKYTDEAPPRGILLQHDESVKDADGNVVPNGSEKPMRGIRFADVNEAMGPGRHSLGEAVVRVCINADGTSAETPLVVRSSGHRDVDEGAVREMMRSTFAPATVNGKPVRSCATAPFKYGW